MPRNLIRRRGRPGYWFAKRIGGKRITRFLGRTTRRRAASCGSCNDARRRSAG